MSGSLFINPTALEAGLQAAFAARSETSEAQAAAFERFARAGFPNRRVEGWKWSDFNAVLRAAAPAGEPAADTVIAPSAFAALDPIEIRIIDGRVSLPEEPAPDGVRFGIIEPVATITELETHAIASLNVAMTRKAFGFEVLESVALERPLHIRHINNAAGFSFAQTLLRMRRNARAMLIETYEGESAGFYSHLCHAAVRDGAAFTRYVLQETGPDRIVHSIHAAKVESAAVFANQSFDRRGALPPRNARSFLEQERTGDDQQRLAARRRAPRGFHQPRRSQG